MKLMRIAAVLLSVLAVGSTAQSTLTGKWLTVIVPGQPRDRMPKMVGDVLLDLKAEGTKLTGTAKMGDGWPGSAPIQGGKIDGNRFSFTWTGAVPSSGGLPHLTFTGAVDGDHMTLSMVGDYATELKGERLPPQ
jgi:hypothetical protein